MKKVGIFVGENNWTFFSEIYDYLSTNYQTQVFKRKTYDAPLLYGRLNRWAFSTAVQALLSNSDICFFEWASDLLAFASHMPKTSKIITRLHSFELYEWAPKINWENVDKVILVSQAMQQMFVELYPQCSRKTQVIYNGRSLERFVFTGEREFHYNLGMLGSISPVKRVYELVLMFHSLLERGCGSPRLHIAGEPDDDYRYAVAVRRLVRKLGLQDRVIFYGKVTDPSSWLQKIDIFISNSYWEGQQVALLEAMASGCYCLAHNWAGADEMLPKGNIFVMDNELINKIIAYYEMSVDDKRYHQALMRSMAIEKFNIETSKLKIHQVIESLLE